MSFQDNVGQFKVSAQVRPAAASLTIGETFEIELKSSQDARVVIWNKGPDGEVQSLSDPRNPKPGVLLKANVASTYPSSDKVLRLAGPPGRNVLTLVFSNEISETREVNIAAITGGNMIRGEICLDAVE